MRTITRRKGLVDPWNVSVASFSGAGERKSREGPVSFITCRDVGRPVDCKLLPRVMLLKN